MGDLISRAAAIDAIVSVTSFLEVDSIKSIYNIGNGEEWVDGVYDAIKAVEEVNAVDAVPVVRCRDCVYFCQNVHDRGDDSRCALWNVEMCADDYCSKARRRCNEDFCEIGGE